MKNPSKLIILLLCFFVFSSISACSKSKLLTVYKIDIQQGNAVELKKVEQLEVGMSKEQVEFLLGTPLLTDSFHPARWDYVYFLLPGFGERERRHLTIYFDGDFVSEIVKKDIPPISAEETAVNTKENQSSKEREN
jgi:outer membrane protein assembly factor BamE